MDSCWGQDVGLRGPLMWPIVSVMEGGVWHQDKRTELNCSETEYPPLISFEEVLLCFHKEGVRVHEAVKEFRLITASS